MKHKKLIQHFGNLANKINNHVLYYMVVLFFNKIKNKDYTTLKGV